MHLVSDPRLKSWAMFGFRSLRLGNVEADALFACAHVAVVCVHKRLHGNDLMQLPLFVSHKRLHAKRPHAVSHKRQSRYTKLFK